MASSPPALLGREPWGVFCLLLTRTGLILILILILREHPRIRYRAGSRPVVFVFRALQSRSGCFCTEPACTVAGESHSAPDRGRVSLARIRRGPQSGGGAGHLIGSSRSPFFFMRREGGNAPSCSRHVLASSRFLLLAYSSVRFVDATRANTDGGPPFFFTKYSGF